MADKEEQLAKISCQLLQINQSLEKILNVQFGIDDPEWLKAIDKLEEGFGLAFIWVAKTKGIHIPKIYNNKDVERVVSEIIKPIPKITGVSYPKRSNNSLVPDNDNILTYPFEIKNDDDYDKVIKQIKELKDREIIKHKNILLHPIKMLEKEITDQFHPIEQKQEVFESRMKEAIKEYKIQKDKESEIEKGG